MGSFRSRGEIHSCIGQTPRAVSVSEVRACLHDAARFRARSTSHTVAAQDGCTKIPLAAAGAQGGETILWIGISGHGCYRFVHPDPPLRQDWFGWRSARPVGQLRLAWSSPESVFATSLCQSAGRYPPPHGICRTEFCDWGSSGFFALRRRWAPDRAWWEFQLSLVDGGGLDGLCAGLRLRPQQAGLRTNIRFKFQAMVTRLHSPRTFSRPRREN